MPPGVLCGNGQIDEGEGCDDGNLVNGDSCTNDCARVALCGNGVLDELDAQPAEACDDANNVDGDGCSANCLSNETCGNGYRDLTESCDDGNNNNGDGCSATCVAEECGNGHMDPGETCDDGNNDNGDGCSADCLSTEVCGNGFVDIAVGENCDDGNTEPDDGCNPVCRLENCGNGQLNPGEVCDDGNNESGDGCSADCVSTELCGNSYIDVTTGESCDDGNNNNGDGCSAVCQLESCGNGIIESGETCDDGNNNNGDGCSADCLSDESCGNGYRDVNEQCDDGNDAVGDGCSAACLLEYCGNGIVDGALGEVCDDGNSVAGDGCSLGCLSDESCGNGLVDTAVGEECEDGNADNNDNCTDICQFPNCRDGYTNVDEIDVDCGGHCGPGSCYLGQVCLSDDDCASNDCAAGVCRGNDHLVQGGSHTCVLRATGSVRCWGENSNGRLGYGNTIDIGDNEMPASAGDVDVGGAVIQLVAGNEHTCALLDTGAVRCWGRNYYGELGYGHTTDIGDNETPASVGDIVLGGTAVHLTAGNGHTCALLDTGAVRCWGLNYYGQLGYGNTTAIGDNESPASAGDIVLGGTAVQLTAGGYHTCALLDTGAIRCWGRNYHGQLGYGNTTAIGDTETPASAGDVPVGGTVEAIDAGWGHTCALLSTGAMRCWGYNDFGQLGYGHTNYIGDNENPASAGDIDTGGTVVQMSAFSPHTCALLSTGVLRCWGRNYHGQLGYGHTDNIGDNEVPSSVSPILVAGSVGGDIAGLAVGTSNHTCVRLATGGLRCWGNNVSGLLGYGHTDRIGDNPGEMPPADIEVDDPCPGDLQGLRGNNGQSLVCHCSAAATAIGTVWGTDIYSDDSGVCKAAVHAGAITTAGGTVTAEILPGQASYTGSTQNGVTSTSLGSHPGSYQFLGL